MRVFEVDTDVNRYAMIVPVAQDFDTDDLSVAPLLDGWIPLRCQMKETHLPVPDLIPFFGSGFVCDAATRKMIAGTLGRDVEFLPLQCDGAEYELVHVTSLIDCLNEEKSELDRLPDGQVVDYGSNRYCFNEGQIGSSTIFRVPQLRAFNTFCTEEFERCVGQLNLSGVLFREC